MKMTGEVERFFTVLPITRRGEAETNVAQVTIRRLSEAAPIHVLYYTNHACRGFPSAVACASSALVCRDALPFFLFLRGRIRGLSVCNIPAPAAQEMSCFDTVSWGRNTQVIGYDGRRNPLG